MHALALALARRTTEREAAFANGLTALENFLPPEQFHRLAHEIEQLSITERSYVPTHKKGGTVAYGTLMREAPTVVAFYRSPELSTRISAVVGAPVSPTPDRDQSSCSVLFYEKPGDHIGWHYDHNFYLGRHFTALLPIVNRDRGGTGLSSAQLHAMLGGEERAVPTPANRLIVFEGARVRHRATPVAEGERRVVLSMTFCTDPRNTLQREIARRIKDTAYFGIRALWT